MHHMRPRLCFMYNYWLTSLYSRFLLLSSLTDFLNFVGGSCLNKVSSLLENFSFSSCDK